MELLDTGMDTGMEGGRGGYGVVFLHGRIN